jgi:hypothetical protein
MSLRLSLFPGALLASVFCPRLARAEEAEESEVPAKTQSKGVEVSGQVAADGRMFFQRPKYAGQEFGAAVSLMAEPELKYKTKNEKHTFKLHPFYRLDPIDERRSHPDLREASYALTLEHFEAGLGVGTFTWGALESYRPVDVLNQIDFAESSDGTAKLGQPSWAGWPKKRPSRFTISVTFASVPFPDRAAVFGFLRSST